MNASDRNDPLRPLLAPAFWYHRWWRPDPVAGAAFAGLTPAVVITGASTGIGLAMAQQLATGGRCILMIARNAQRLETAAAVVRRATTARVMTLSADITAPGILPLLDAALADLGAYADVLVNNAGVGLSGPLATQKPDALANLLALNIGALTALCRHVLPGQLVRGRGGIINIASFGGFLPGPQQAAYYASKAYVLSFSVALAAETSGYGLRIAAVTPGPVDTGFHSTMGAEAALYRQVWPGMSPDRVARSAIAGFRRRQRIIVPGVIAQVLRIGVWLLPVQLLTPITAALLRRPTGPQ